MLVSAWGEIVTLCRETQPLGGVVVLISNLAQLWSVIPLNGTLAGAAAAPVFAFEVWFALHLIVVGLPHRQADAPQ